MKFCFYTLGCKVNHCETQALCQIACDKGHQITTHDADVCIINTCTVTSTGDHKNIRMFRKAKKENPRAIIAAMGCFSQVEPQKVLALAEVDLICGTGNRTAIIEQCEQAVLGKHQSIADTVPPEPSASFEQLPAGVPAGRTRALLKIQDGCDNYCTYCIIPYARGHVRSLPPDAVMKQIKQLHDKGVREIVLTGIEISSYGQDFATKTDIICLIHDVCKAVPEMRIRLSSLEPRTANDEFCRKLSDLPNLMHHFHLSLQSGSDSVLHRMKRKYSTIDFLEIVCRLRATFPKCSITTDIIVGFPGETEEEFQQTVNFIRSCDFADIHVFPYSLRNGTVAATMTNQIPADIKKQRVEVIKKEAKIMSERFLQGFIGDEMHVLLEHEIMENVWIGHGTHHFPITIYTTQGKKNKILRVLLTEKTDAYLAGKPL